MDSCVAPIIIGFLLWPIARPFAALIVRHQVPKILRERKPDFTVRYLWVLIRVIGIVLVVLGVLCWLGISNFDRST